MYVTVMLAEEAAAEEAAAAIVVVAGGSSLAGLEQRDLLHDARERSRATALQRASRVRDAASAARAPPLQARPMQAARPEPIDCASLVKPVDWPPIRSPQAVHSTVAELLRKTDAVEIGTRNGDGMRCFAQTARSAVAIELESRYCTELRLHSRNMTAAGLGGFRVHCQDYRRGTPDADFYTLWEHVESAAYR